MKTPNPQRAKELRLKRLFNISLEEYNLLGNTCMICGREGKTRHISIDHDHKTGLIRGVLCMSCNTGLAKFRDDPLLLSVASEYLQSPPASLMFGCRYGRIGRVNKKVGKKKKR